MTYRPLFLAIAAAFFAVQAQAADKISTPASDPALTLYSDGYGLVHEVRSISLDKGPNVIAIEGLPEAVRPDSVLAGGKGLTVQRRVFDFAAISPKALLENSLGKTVGVIKTNPQTGEETEVEATVLSLRGGVVLRIGDRIETGVPGRLVFRDIPEGLRAKPALTLLAESTEAGTQPLILTYITGGLDWSATYVAQLNKDGTALDLTGYAQLTNNTERSFNDAAVRVVAGEVRRPAPPQPVMMDQAVRFGAMAAAPAAKAESLERQSTGEQHIYTLPGKISLASHQTQQVTLLSATAVPAKTEYLFQNGVYRQPHRGNDAPQRPEIRVSFMNDKASGLGVPLPAGALRTFKGAGPDTLFTGETFLARKAAGEKAQLTLGRAFDITLKRTQTDFQVKDPKGRDRTFEAAWDLELTNAHDKPVTVVLDETMSGEWEILTETRRHEKDDAATARWTVTLKPESTETVSYRVRVTPR